MKYPVSLSAKHPILRKINEDADGSNCHEETEYVRSILLHKF